MTRLLHFIGSRPLVGYYLDFAVDQLDRTVKPVVGIPLPFVSHGGSSMMTNMICIGSLMMVYRWNRQSRPGGLLR